MNDHEDRKRKVYNTFVKNNVMRILLGLDENNKNPIFGPQPIPEEELKLFANIMADEMSKELTEDQVEYYCNYIQNENYSSVSKAHSKAISSAFLFMIHGKVNTDKREDVSVSCEEGSNSSIQLKDDCVFINQQDYDPEKLN